jgi:hypothetical protein
MGQAREVRIMPVKPDRIMMFLRCIFVLSHLIFSELLTIGRNWIG